MAASASALSSGTLPIPRTRLIGRDAERDAARTFLLDAAVPLLTLTGPGGVGKTRLALAIAHSVASAFADGVIWVDLAPLADPALVPPTVAAVLGVIQSSHGSLADDLSRALHARQTLLLLDNCEHVLDATAELVSVLLVRCPALQVLATSRASLHVRSEQLLPIDPLPVPVSGASLEQFTTYEAISLFVERAHAVWPTFALNQTNAATVATLCEQLDGLPLAIELAAARSNTLSPDALLAQMSNRLGLLTRGARDLPARQQTISATIAWSYDLLPPEVQVLFRLLAVFTGGFTLDAARAMAECGAAAHKVSTLIDDLAFLVEQSLVRREEREGEPRFTMLETIRAFGLDQLVRSGEDEAARGRHARWFRERVAALDLYHANAGDESWYRDLRDEQHNLRQALAWFTARGDALALNELSAALFKFWLAGSQFTEGRHWLDQAIASDAGVPLLVRSRAWGGAGTLAAYQGDYAVAAPLLEQSLVLARECGDPVRLSEALIESGVLAGWQGDLARGIADNEEAERVTHAIAPTRPVGPLLRGMALVNQGWMLQDAGDRAATAARYQEAIPLLRGPGGTWSLSVALRCRGNLLLEAGAITDATADLLEGLALTWVRGDEASLTRELQGVAVVAAHLGLMTSAAQLLGIADAIALRTGHDQESFDQKHVQWCLALLNSTIDVATVAQLRRAGAALTAQHGVALARGTAIVVLGGGRVEGIWEAAGAPDPGPAPAEPNRDPGLVLVSGLSEAASKLTYRERDVLTLLCQRLTDREIAEQLFLSPRTVSNHVGNILSKLGARNRREVTALAARASLV